LGNFPFGTAFCTSLTCSGLIICCLTRDGVLPVLESAGDGFRIVWEFVRLLYLPMVFVTVLDVLGLLLAFAVYVQKFFTIKEDESSLCLLLNLGFARSDVVGIVEVLTKVTFVFQLLLSYMLFIPFLFWDTLVDICEGGPRVLEEARNLSATLRNSSGGARSFAALAVDLDIDRYCAAAAGLGKDTFWLFFGVGLTVLGQGGLLSCMSELMDTVCQGNAGGFEDSAKQSPAVVSPDPSCKGELFDLSNSSPVRIPPALSPLQLQARGREAASGTRVSPASPASDGSTVGTMDTIPVIPTRSGARNVVEFTRGNCPS